MLSQSKDKLSHLNSTVYSCYSCVRLRRGLFFFIVSVVYRSLHKIPIKIHCLACLSIFGGVSKKRGDLFFIVSVGYKGLHQIPIIIHCLTRLSILARL